MTRTELASILRHAAERIEADDSFEGLIGWVATIDGYYPFGAYRFDNLNGQGSMCVLGNEEEAREASDRDFAAARKA